MLLAPSWFMAFGRRPKVARSLLDTLLFADDSVERCGSRSRDHRRAKPHGLQMERSPAYCARKTGARLRSTGHRNLLKRHRQPTNRLANTTTDEEARLGKECDSPGGRRWST